MNNNDPLFIPKMVIPLGMGVLAINYALQGNMLAAEAIGSVAAGLMAGNLIFQFGQANNEIGKRNNPSGPGLLDPVRKTVKSVFNTIRNVL